MINNVQIFCGVSPKFNLSLSKFKFSVFNASLLIPSFSSPSKNSSKIPPPFLPPYLVVPHMVEDLFPVSSSDLPKLSPTKPPPFSFPSSLSYTIKVFAYVLVFLTSMGFIVYYAKNLQHFLEHIKDLGLVGNLILIISYLPAGLPFAFVSYYIPLSLSAGFLYGYALGIVTTMIGSVSSGVFGFWIARTFCREWIQEKIKSSARLSALLIAMEVHSFKITLMVRFLPLPFGLQNGLCAMTSISPPMYLLASIIGLLPENVLLIYFGSSFESISELARGDFGQISILEKIFLVVAVVVTALIVLLGRQMLNVTLAIARAGNKKAEDAELLEGNFSKIESFENQAQTKLSDYSTIGLLENPLKSSCKIDVNTTVPPPYE